MDADAECKDATQPEVPPSRLTAPWAKERLARLRVFASEIGMT